MSSFFSPACLVTVGHHGSCAQFMSGGWYIDHGSGRVHCIFLHWDDLALIEGLRRPSWRSSYSLLAVAPVTRLRFTSGRYSNSLGAVAGTLIPGAGAKPVLVSSVAAIYLCDSHFHASIHDGTRVSRARSFSFSRKSVRDLQEVLGRLEDGHPGLVSGSASFFIA